MTAPTEKTSLQSTLLLVRIVNEVVARVIAAVGDPAQTGAYFQIVERVAEPQRRVILGTWMVGHLVPAEATECHAYVGTKIDTLVANPNLRSTHAVRNPDARIWGGGIWIKDGWIALSGLTETQDLAAALLIALELNQLDLEDALDVAQTTDNELALRLIKEA